jgi:hypothetical protein
MSKNSRDQFGGQGDGSIDGARNNAGVRVGIGGFRALLAPLVARLQLGSRLGLTFDGKRDLYAQFGYRRAITFDDYANRYARQDVARIVVSLPAISTWKVPPQVTDSQGLDGQFSKSWAALNARIGLIAALLQADKISGIGIYGGLFIGYADGKRLEQPVTPFPSPADMTNWSTPPQIAYMVPLSEGALQISQIDGNLTSPRYGLPLMYRLTVNANVNAMITSFPMGPMASPSTSAIDVHWTRILHLADDRAESPIIGTPRMQSVFNRLDDLEKIVGGSAETFWLNARKGLHANVDPEMALAPADEAQLSDEMEEYEHQLRRIIRTRGVDIKDLGTNVADPSKAFDVCITAISAATRIPKRMLIGSELGQTASEEDRANWGETVQSRQVNYAEPYVLRPLIQALTAFNVLPEPQGAVQIIWPPAITMNIFDQARTAGHIARAAASIAEQRKYGVYVMTPQEFREGVLDMPHGVAQQVEYFTPVAPPTAGGADGGSSGSDGSGNPGGG